MKFYKITDTPIDGFTLFGDEGRSECTLDGTHPNALEFMCMAEKVYPVLNKIIV